MAKNYFKRYIWLIELLYRRGHASFGQISRAWASSPLNTLGDSRLPERTFFNHIAAIEDIFDIVIKCNRTSGEYYIANTDDLEKDGIRSWLLQSISLNNLLEESTGMRDRILFEKVPSSQQWLTAIIDAMRAEKAIVLTYQSFRRDEPATFIAHPYCLKLFRQRWYMLARSENFKQPLIYSLDRIKDIRPSDLNLKLPRRFNPEMYFDKLFGVIASDDEPEKVLLKVVADQVGYYESLPLHESQRKISSTDEYTIFEYHLAPTYDFEQELLGKGSLAEVLEPQWLREWMADEIEKMKSLYD